MPKIDYFYSTPYVSNHGEGFDNPVSSDFVPLEARGEMERARWWAKQDTARKRFEHAAVPEFEPR